MTAELVWNVEFSEWQADAKTREAASHPQSDASATDPRVLRNALGNFATGVTVVTFEAGGKFRGVTVNSFTSVSLDPPLVLVSLMRSSRSLAYVQDRPFAINILSDAQLRTALEFAGKPQGHPIEWVTDGVAPRLGNSLAHFICDPWAGYDGGDHLLLLGRVLDFGQQDAIDPLLFYRGSWGAFGPHASEGASA
ncbi:MAG: flavin reductase family protein [Microbacterium sp.]|uniref:flavin reductase family protein n=1 Tax=Microbacterium sp. TaxID=51671 RepID=UPI003F7DFDFF